MATSSRGRILIVDDEANAREALDELLRDEGYETATAADGLEAIAQIHAFEPEVVLTDLKMPRMDGLELLERGRALLPNGAFVVMTAFGSIDTAVAAIRRGAENYLTKPLDFDALGALVERAMDKAKLSAEAARLRERLETRYSFGEIIGDHPSMQRLLKTIGQVASSRATVLITGETGTGKELIAAAIHQNSKRKDGPFVRLNCASLAESLLESELFGHEKGSFTGATGRRQGRFEQADGGTLFLDEVSEIPLAVQVKLLRFLQERELERVGGNETIRVDVRVVAATNRDLAQRVEEGEFREDLYYRLNVISLDVPPLRRRQSDVPQLATHFLRRFARENDRDIRGFTPEAMRALTSYPWPGNVRELENAIERAVVLCSGAEIDADLLPRAAEEAPHGKVGAAHSLDALFPGTTLAELERIAIEKTLRAVDGSTARAAELLGVSRRKIQYRLKEWSGEEE
ncbi:MAG: sigma-54-dependent Fis family transcriptional regulator [Sandaracinaceae bacterium]|nr:sigma-54-dependent Fis family transcriptional regulator [Sandaracinaceae bacterium]